MIHYPNLIHPLLIQIAPVDTASTVYDEYSREPLQIVARTATISIYGQIRWYSKEKLKTGAYGPMTTATGHIIFLKRELDAVSYTPKVNDRITAIAGETVNLYIIGIPNCIHYDGVPKAYRVYFSDKQPARD